MSLPPWLPPAFFSPPAPPKIPTAMAVGQGRENATPRAICPNPRGVSGSVRTTTPLLSAPRSASSRVAHAWSLPPVCQATIGTWTSTLVSLSALAQTLLLVLPL